MPFPSQQERRNIFTLVEEATHLLRRTPAGAWLAYFAGSAPFVLFLFYFWSDMSRSPLAARHVVGMSFVLALVYVWMKCWQAVFCGHLSALLEGRADTGSLSTGAWLRLVGSQALVHSTMPWMLALASVAVLPVAWVYAFYHNVTILAVGHFRDGGRTRPLLAKALAQAHFEPKPNHLLMLLVNVVFGPMVYLNFFAIFVLATMLLKSFTGVENAFTRSGMLYFSSALHVLLFSLTYLVVNPFIKALYVLRCFYGAARKNGADIAVSLRAVSAPAVAPLVLLLLLLLAGTCPTASAQSAAPPVRPGARAQVDPGTLPGQELERAIRDVLQGDEFQWRFPRERAMEGDDSWLGALIRAIGKWFNDMLDAIGRLIGWIIDWLFGDDEQGGSRDQPGSAWLALMPKLVLALVVVLIGMLVWMLWKNLKQARQTAAVAAEEAEPPPVNLESEHVLASQLPENEWLQLAREKTEAGELRLALRALFLATLAHLGEKRLLQIAKSKSNGDYVRELGWRARGRDELNERFNQQVRTFDRVWYGWHEVSRDLMSRFQEQHERITLHAT